MADGTPGLVLYDSYDKVRVGLASMEPGPALDFLNAEGNVQAKLVLTDVGPRLFLFDAEGRLIYKAS